VEAVPAPVPGVPDQAGLVTPTGIVTPDHLVLRKKDVGAAAPPEEARPLYQVLQQRDTKVGSAAFGSAHTYVINEEKPAPKPGKGEAVNLIKSQKTKEVAITLNPSELEDLTDDKLKEKYEAAVKATAQPEREDLSDLVAEHTKKRAKKEAKEKDKKYKDFKF